MRIMGEKMCYCKTFIIGIILTFKSFEGEIHEMINECNVTHPLADK